MGRSRVIPEQGNSADVPIKEQLANDWCVTHKSEGAKENGKVGQYYG